MLHTEYIHKLSVDRREMPASTSLLGFYCNNVRVITRVSQHSLSLLKTGINKPSL